MFVVEGAPLIARLRLEDLLDLPVRFRAGICELVLDQVLAADRRAEATPELRLERPAGDPAIGCLVGAVTDDPAGEHHLAPLRHLAGAEVASRLHHQPCQRAVGHRDVDHLALAAPTRLLQRGQDSQRRHQGPAAEVGDLGARLDRRSARLTGQPEHAVQAQVVLVVPGAVAVRAVLPVAGDRAVDERRVRLAQDLITHPELVEHPRAEALHEDVSRLGELDQRLPSPLVLEIQPDRALVAVERQVDGGAGAERRLLVCAVVRRRPADVVALAGVLHLDHVGAEVGEQQGAEAARQQPGQVENLDVGKRTVAHALASSRLGTPSNSRASATVAARRPTSSAIWRALAISSPFEVAISPFGR